MSVDEVLELPRRESARRRRDLVTRALAAVDVQNFSRDERCGIKKQNRVGDVAHLAHASERMEGAQRFMGFRRVHRRLDDPRRDGIHARRQRRWRAR